jgi:hypothetical protein
VIVFDKQAADEAIAAKAVAQLRDDLKKHDHILMARVSNISRAQEVYEIYARYTEFTTVQIHTGIKSDAERNRIRNMILGRQARIVVCVDMLGEGFDLPELKIAAFHDIRKSLAVTVQLIGRFTRAKSDLGEATCIANIGDVEVRDELRKLYMQGANWNQLLIQSSEMIIGEQLSLQDFLDGFGATPEEIPLQSMRPALSTVIYRTKSKHWKPENLQAKLSKDANFEQVYTTVNESEKTLIVVTARRAGVDWAQLKDVVSWNWELLIVHWDEEQNLLFIHGSGNEGYYKEIAQAVMGNAELITGPPVFRVFSGVNRLRLQNVGLAEQLGRLIRYTMRAGSDVETGLTAAQKRNVRKSNIFGTGYEYGEKTSVGCSYRGRIWSQRRGNVSSLVRWFRRVGAKVVDEQIDPDQVLSGTLTPRPTAERPNVMPIGIEWPEVFYTEPETMYDFVIDGTVVVPLYLAELSLTDPSEQGDITFKLETLETSVAFTLMLRQQDEDISYSYTIEAGRSVVLRRRGTDTSLTDFFYSNPPVIWFADGASLEGNSLTELKRLHAPYPVERVQVWNWTDTDIHKESQGANKESDSIQYKVIAELKKGNYQIIVDDDDSGEAADVVAVRVEDKAIIIELYHCKYSHGDTPGSRIKDLYEVCGQAQRSVHWVEKPTELLNHLLRRDENRTKQGKQSRIEVGTSADILNVREGTRMMQVQFAIYIVQPGLSKAEASLSQLELLSVTENYLGETYQIPFGVIASK